MEQLATFHTHFGALTFQNRLRSAGDQPVMAPVPRVLSASCGVCVHFALPFDADTMADEDLDAVYSTDDGGYHLLFQNGED